MSYILNEIGTQCAVFGNHDFGEQLYYVGKVLCEYRNIYIITIITDFGLEILADRVAETNFPWLMSNALYNETGRPLGDGKITHVIEWNGKRIGMVMKLLVIIAVFQSDLN